MRQGGGEEEYYKGAMVSFPDAVDDEETMVVEVVDASSTEPAVLGPDWTDDLKGKKEKERHRKSKKDKERAGKNGREKERHRQKKGRREINCRKRNN